MSPAIPRPAASLILLREGPDGVEVLLGQRRGTARAFPGAVVFPGGKVEPGDAQAEAQAGVPSGVPPAPRGAAYAAVRETFEETGLWLAADGSARDAAEAPGLGRLNAFAHWITPERHPYRFDTWFFLARATAAEAHTPLAGDEFERLDWRRAADVLADGSSLLLPPTRHSLSRLAPHHSVAAILEEARTTAPFEAGDFETRWGA